MKTGWFGDLAVACHGLIKRNGVRRDRQVDLALTWLQLDHGAIFNPLAVRGRRDACGHDLGDDRFAALMGRHGPAVASSFTETLLRTAFQNTVGCGKEGRNLVRDHIAWDRVVLRGPRSTVNRSAINGEPGESIGYTAGGGDLGPNGFFLPRPTQPPQIARFGPGQGFGGFGPICKTYS